MVRILLANFEIFILANSWGLRWICSQDLLYVDYTNILGVHVGLGFGDVEVHV
jgi:hypothetical protein